MPGVGVTANALQVGTNSYALELTSNGTGTASSTTIDTQAFAGSGLGALLTTTAAQNAVVSVGGTGGYQVTSQTNALSGLLPGITINLGSVSSTPVTVTVSPDGSSVAGNVQTLVTAANQLLSTISTDTSYNTQTKTAGPLNGDQSLTGLAQQVLAAVGEAVGRSGAGSDGTAGESAGLAITSQGTITFNQTAFEAAYEKDPTGVQSMFTEGGTFAAALPAYAGQVSVAGATDNTSPGAYAVSVTQSAQQAVDTGSSTWASSAAALVPSRDLHGDRGVHHRHLCRHGGGAHRRRRERHEHSAGRRRHRRLGCACRLRWCVSGPAGVSGLRVRGHVPGGGVRLRPARIDVQRVHLHGDGRGRHHQRPGRGGLGQYLSSYNSGDNTDGLVVQVTTPGITSATALGTVTYAPGFGQGLAHIAATASLAPNGIIPVTIAGLQGTLAEVGSEISMQQQLVATQQAALTAEFTNMETTLSQLQSESSFLNQAFGSSSSSDSSSSSSSLGSASTSSSNSSSGG